MVAKTQSNIDSAKVARQWPEFSEFELEHVCKGLRVLCGGLQAKYGISRDEAARQIERVYQSIVKRSV